MGVKGITKYNYNDVKDAMESKGYILLSTTLCAPSNKLDYICKKHIDKGIQHISIYHALCGRGCYYCGRERTEEGRKAKINKDEDKTLCEKHGFEYVDTVVENHIVWIHMICPFHRHVGVQKVRKGNLQREATYKCVYCIGRKVYPLDSFGNKHPESINLWGDQNKKLPLNILHQAIKKHGLSVKTDCMKIIIDLLMM